MREGQEFKDRELEVIIVDYFVIGAVVKKNYKL